MIEMNMSRDELREYLFKEWEKISTSLLGLSDARVDYYYEEGEDYEDFPCKVINLRVQ